MPQETSGLAEGLGWTGHPARDRGPVGHRGFHGHPHHQVGQAGCSWVAVSRATTNTRDEENASAKPDATGAQGTRRPHRLTSITPVNQDLTVTERTSGRMPR